MDTISIVWLTVLIVSVVAEAITFELVAIWFMPAAVVAWILSRFGVPVPVQILVFLLVALLLLILFRRVCMEKMNKKDNHKTNAEALIGEKAVVTEEINNEQWKGSAKVHFQDWTARSVKDDTVIPTGTEVIIRAITGCKLMVEPVEESHK